ncbi:hypothetical protein F5887DRAFT_1284229 [Amanita rubescens]|nr:hypothetical protein F5887DRAFT_1284229 [Amanita rubescens]
MYDNVAVETIPSEILCEIFQHLCDSDNAISLHVLDNNPCSDEFPWAVGQVCKRWREIFLSCPRLWTSLFLQHCSNSDISEDYLREMSRRTLLYLERSKQLPLTITVHTLSFGDNDNFPRTTWKLLLSCSERWERVHLSLCHETSSLLDLLKCKMPIVESLWIWVERHGLADFQLCNPFTAAPCLTELELPGWLGEWVLKFPWSQLTKVKIPTTNFGDVIDNNNLETILSQLRNVEELRMDKMSIWRRNVRDWCSSPIRLPSLRFLSVPVYSPFTILRRLEAPLLEHLWVDWCPMFDREEGYHSVIFAEDLSYFIRHSSCRIRRLTLDDCESILSSDLTEVTFEHREALHQDGDFSTWLFPCRAYYTDE